jgi:hypothetical protein
MKNLKDTCIEFFKNENTRKDLQDIIQPIVSIIYNEVYIYLWVLCFYVVILFIIVLANLVLLLHLLKKINIYKLS